MDLGLRDKVVLVTGGSRGIGRAIATEFAAEGAKLAVVARGREVLESVTTELHAKFGVETLPLAADLTRTPEVQRLVAETLARFGRIDVLVNNAGNPSRGKFDQRSDEAFSQELSLKMFGYVRLCREVFPRMLEQRSGRIINITGQHGTEPGYYNPSSLGWISGMECAALMNLTKSLAFDGGPHNVLVNSISPGYFWTDITLGGVRRRAEESGQKQEELIEARNKSQLLGRAGDPREIAAVAVFLASQRASFITGTVIPVNGGNAHSY